MRYGRLAPVGERVADIDWSGDDLGDRTATGGEFVRIEATEATGAGGPTFEDCVFRDCAFNLVELTGAGLLNCTFTGCDFFGARLTDCKFVGSRFERCSFDQLTVSGGDWSFVTLRGATLRTARIVDVRMREVDLTGVEASGATLRNVDLAGATFKDAVLAGADLRGSNLSAVDPWSVRLTGAKITWEQAVVLASALGLAVSPE